MPSKSSRCIEASRSATNLFKGEYAIEEDPVIKQRLSSMAKGGKATGSKEGCLEKLHSHLPTTSTNEDLIGL